MNGIMVIARPVDKARKVLKDTFGRDTGDIFEIAGGDFLFHGDKADMRALKFVAAMDEEGLRYTLLTADVLDGSGVISRPLFVHVRCCDSCGTTYYTRPRVHHECHGVTRFIASVDGMDLTLHIPSTSDLDEIVTCVLLNSKTYGVLLPATFVVGYGYPIRFTKPGNGLVRREYVEVCASAIGERRWRLVEALSGFTTYQAPMSLIETYLGGVDLESRRAANLHFLSVWLRGRDLEVQCLARLARTVDDEASVLDLPLMRLARDVSSIIAWYGMTKDVLDK